MDLDHKVSQLHSVTQAAFDARNVSASFMELQTKYDAQVDVLNRANAKILEQRDQISDGVLATEIATKDLSIARIDLEKSQQQCEVLETDLKTANLKINALEDDLRGYRNEVAIHKEDILGLLPEMEVLKSSNKSSEQRLARCSWLRSAEARRQLRQCVRHCTGLTNGPNTI